ncbi:hypothetical protein BG004_006560 [Podila humilis]|nr:hypothetical protein BG004_006560 [Podila humilis]
MYQPDTSFFDNPLDPASPQPHLHQPSIESLRAACESEYHLRQQLYHQEQHSNLNHNQHNISPPPFPQENHLQYPRSSAIDTPHHVSSHSHHRQTYDAHYFDRDDSPERDNESSYFLYPTHPDPQQSCHSFPLTPSSLPSTLTILAAQNNQRNNHQADKNSNKPYPDAQEHFQEHLLQQQSGFTLSISKPLTQKQQQQQYHIRTSTATPDYFRAHTPVSETLVISTASTPATKTSPTLSNAAAHRGSELEDGDDDIMYSKTQNPTQTQHGRHGEQSAEEISHAGATTSPTPAPSTTMSTAIDFIVRALHEYHTDNEGHLSFEQFQYIKVKHCEPSGWWLGESESSRGWFPSNRVERVAEEYETEITSEDYDQIRTGLDGVESQFLGEPASSISDTISENLRSRGGHLAFPSSILGHLSILPSENTLYGSEASTTDVESDYFYQQAGAAASSTSLSNATNTAETSTAINELSLAYSDFVAEIALLVEGLKDSTSRGDVARYQPIVANIISCVKALLVFTNTITRDSPVLAAYPDLARSRRIILRALGKLYSKCRVANGSQALTTTRQRQFAVEKLGMFANQIFGGIQDFTSRARDIGLQFQPNHLQGKAIDILLDESSESRLSGLQTRARSRDFADGRGSSAELDLAFMASNDREKGPRTSVMAAGAGTSTTMATTISANIATTFQTLTQTPVSSSSSSHGRGTPRRRVSRANSAKGFKSFNAVRSIKAEHTQKFNAARKAIESLFGEYMESMKEKVGPLEMQHILRKSVEAAKVVEIFLASAMDIKVRTQVKEDNEFVQLKNELSSALDEFFEYMHKVETALLTQERSLESIMTVLMSLTSVLLKKLVDLDAQPKRNSQGALLQAQQSKDQEQESTSRPSSTISDRMVESDLVSTSSTNESLPPLPRPNSKSKESLLDALSSSQPIEISPAVARTISPSTTKAASRNTAPVAARIKAGPGLNGQNAALNRKFGSLTSLNDRFKRQGRASHSPNDNDSLATTDLLNPEAAYGEAHDLETRSRSNSSNGRGSDYRTNHDSAVVILSGNNTPHHSIVGGRKIVQKSHDQELVTVTEYGNERELRDGTEDLEHRPQPSTSQKSESDQTPPNPIPVSMSRMVQTVFVAPQASMMIEEVVAHLTPEEPESPRILDGVQTLAAAKPSRSPRMPPTPEHVTRHAVKSGKPTTEERHQGTRYTSASPSAMRAQQTVPSPRLGPKSTASEQTGQIGLGLTLTANGTISNLPRQNHAQPSSLGSVPMYGGSIPRAPHSRRARSPGASPSSRLDGSRRAAKPDGTSTSPLLDNGSASSVFAGSETSKQQSSSSRVIPPSRRESRDYYQQERRPSHSSIHPMAAPSSAAAATSAHSEQRRNSKTTNTCLSNGPRSESRLTNREDELLFSGLLTPGTLQIQSFNQNGSSDLSPSSPHLSRNQAMPAHPPPPPNTSQSAPRRPGKNQQRRQSTLSNLSVATECSQYSVASTSQRTLRPVSPSGLSTRSKVSHEYGRRTPVHGGGRTSSESTQTLLQERDSHQHQQQQHNSNPSARTSPVTGQRVRQNRVGQSRSTTPQQQPYSPTSARHGGNEVATSPTTPWFLEEDYESDEVLYNDNQQLVGATLDAFIELLTTHKDSPEPMFVSTFFTTFRLFTNPVELVSLLVQRFTKQPPSGLSEHERVLWSQQKQDRVRKRVHLALKAWLDSYWVSERDRAAFTPIMEFVTQEMMEALPGPAGRMLDMLNQWVNRRQSLNLGGRSQAISRAKSHERLNQVVQETVSSSGSSSSHKSGGSTSSGGNSPNTNSHGGSSSKFYSSTKEKSPESMSIKNSRRGLGFGSSSNSGGGGRDSTNNRGPPVPLVNKALLNALSNELTMTKVPVTDIKPIELARQLTIMVGKLYCDIPYLELLGKERPNCSRMIQVSNKITIWVTDTIVDETDVKKRIGVVKHWIEVGEECLKINNFDTLTAISCAIESTPVKRLYNTWEGISKSYVERSVQLRKMISSDMNYSVYRAKLKTVQAPCIPFLGLYLTVIAYIEDGNSTYKELNLGSSLTTSTTNGSNSQGQVLPNTPATPSPSSTAGGAALPENNNSTVPSKKLLRYGRFFQLTKAVQEFRDFQGAYELLEVPRLRDYILKCMENQDSERNYRKSLAIEPRRPSGGVGAGTVGHYHHHRSSGGGGGNGGSGSGGNKGLFHSGILNSEVNGNGGGGGKTNKLSFFNRKSGRS